MAIFGPKPWVNPFGKMSIFRLFQLLAFIALKTVFSFWNIVKEIFPAYIAKKTKFEKWPFLEQNHGLTLLEKCQVFDYLKFLCKNFDFLTKTLDWTLWKISLFLKFLKSHFSGLERIHFYPEYKKNIFSGLSCPQNTDGEKFNFLTKTMEERRWKISIFWNFLKLYSSGIKSILFYPEYQKTMCSGFICPKLHNAKD